MNCTLSSINSLLTIKDKCIFVSNNCSYEYINFYSFHYCIMRGIFPLSTVIIILILFILFFILSSTSDMYLSSSITRIIETFKINQNIAAVTLLAFGNGAPDVISTLVASSEPEGISFSINSVLGSGMFITSFVLGLVVYRGKDILVNSNMFNRNLILYLIALGHIILIGIKKKIHLFDSMGFIFIYLLNICFSFCNKKQKKENVENNNDNNNEIIYDEKIKEDKNNKDINAIKEDDNSNKKFKKIELEEKHNSENETKEYIDLPTQETLSNEEIFGEIKEEIIKEQNSLTNNEKAYYKIINENMILARIYLRKNYLYYKEEQWGEISIFKKMFYILMDLPLTYIRELSIPVSENKKWNKTKFCFLPFCNFIFISYVFKCK